MHVPKMKRKSRHTLFLSGLLLLAMSHAEAIAALI